MRQKRAKAYKKLMSLYSMTFGFREPYQVLVDSEICKIASDHKIDLPKQLSTVLQGEVRLSARLTVITQCCIHELYLQGRSRQPTVDLAKSFERRKCNHREPVPGHDCLSSVVGSTNKHRYIIATQSQPLRIELRGIPAVPIVHVNRTVMVLEPPSDLTVETKNAIEEKALHPGVADTTLVRLSTSPSLEHKKKKGPRAKGPNPLSVRRKNPDKVPTPKSKGAGMRVVNSESTGSKRKREEDQDQDELEMQKLVSHKKRRRKNKTS